MSTPHPMTATEREATGALMMLRANIDARLEAVWKDAAARLGIDPKATADIDAKAAAWVVSDEPKAP